MNAVNIKKHGISLNSNIINIFRFALSYFDNNGKKAENSKKFEPTSV